MTTFLITILLLLIFSSLFICGFYKLTRHTLVVMPDESIKTTGFALKWWSEAFEATKGKKVWQYQGEELEAKFRLLQTTNSSLAKGLTISPERMSIMTGPNSGEYHRMTKKDIQFIEDYLQVRVSLKANYMFFFLDEPTYHFPYWFRMMFSACPVCMASPLSFGGAIWWIFCALQKDSFSWSSYPQSVPYVLFIPFCVSLAFINYLVSKKYDL